MGGAVSVVSSTKGTDSGADSETVPLVLVEDEDEDAVLSSIRGDVELQYSKNILTPVSDWVAATIEITHGKVIFHAKADGVGLITIDLEGTQVSLGREEDVLEDNTGIVAIIVIKRGEDTVRIKAHSEDDRNRFLKALQLEIIYCNRSLDAKDRGLHQLDHLFEQFQDVYYNESLPQSKPTTAVDTPMNTSSITATQKKIVTPVMNVVILVVGTKGDMQPFIYLGQGLKNDGHRVRLATHAEYRDDVIKGSLEFYPLGGDPRKLSEYMVKTQGRLMPDLLSEEERRELPQHMKMLKDICFSTYPACTAPDPLDPDRKEFRADAIIANPIAYGHIHCAEKLSVPLHIMFPQPWSPTKCFPHPLSNMGFESTWSIRNYYSYKLVDEIMWLGLGSIFNKFRRTVLELPPIRSGEHGDSLLNDNKVPISHMWSPSFVPKCVDWPEYVDVVGEFRSMTGAPSTFVPPPALVEFLEAGEKPLYIGFGSMVIKNSSFVLPMIKEAAAEVGCRVLLQNGWTKYADDNTVASKEVMVVGAMPHDWLFQQVSAVVHHGGAGTTSAGLRFGNPTFICPFFGDQHFWAEMVFRAGVGPKGCPISELTVEKLVAALQVMRNQGTIKRAKQLGEKMSSEDGAAMGIASFYRNLPLPNMVCDVCVFNNRRPLMARVMCATCGMKMSTEADRVIHRVGGGREDHIRVPYRAPRVGVVAPNGIVDGLGQGFGAAAYEMVGGVYDLFAKPIEGAFEKGVRGAAQGIATGVVNFVSRPVRGGRILVERVVGGALSPRAPEPRPVDSLKSDFYKNAGANGSSMQNLEIHISNKLADSIQEKLKSKNASPFILNIQRKLSVGFKPINKTTSTSSLTPTSFGRRWSRNPTETKGEKPVFSTVPVKPDKKKSGSPATSTKNSPGKPKAVKSTSKKNLGVLSNGLAGGEGDGETKEQEEWEDVKDGGDWTVDEVVDGEDDDKFPILSRQSPGQQFRAATAAVPTRSMAPRTLPPLASAGTASKTSLIQSLANTPKPRTASTAVRPTVRVIDDDDDTLWVESEVTNNPSPVQPMSRSNSKSNISKLAKKPDGSGTSHMESSPRALSFRGNALARAGVADADSSQVVRAGPHRSIALAPTTTPNGGSNSSYSALWRATDIDDALDDDLRQTEGVAPAVGVNRKGSLDTAFMASENEKAKVAKKSIWVATNIEEIDDEELVRVQSQSQVGLARPVAPQSARSAPLAPNNTIDGRSRRSSEPVEDTLAKSRRSFDGTASVSDFAGLDADDSSELDLGMQGAARMERLLREAEAQNAVNAASNGGGLLATAPDIQGLSEEELSLEQAFVRANEFMSWWTRKRLKSAESKERERSSRKGTRPNISKVIKVVRQGTKDFDT